MKQLNSKLKQHAILFTYVIFLYFALLDFKSIVAILRATLNILSPFITAIAIAFILNIPMKLFENKVFFVLDRQKNNSIKKLKRPLSILATFLTVIALLVALIIFVVPQFVSSVSTLLDSVPNYLNSFERLINQYIYSNEIFNNISHYITNAWKELLQLFGQLLGTSLSNLLNVTISFTSGIINFILSIILAIYMLASKESLIAHIKKFLYAFLKKNWVETILKIRKIANVTFTNFIGGQCTEAFILGCLCFIGMNILQLPYSLLISVLVGITALIPIFGAFIGTIPSAFIILIIDPMKAVWFVIFILVLQQIEGHLIYPKVVGSSIGLSPLWVMLAMLVGGSTLGLVGMLIGIPSFAVIYQLISIITNKRLKNKEFYM